MTRFGTRARGESEESVVIGVFRTTTPLGRLFVGSTRQFVTTTATTASITWWALVIGFAIAGGLEARTSNEAVADLLEGLGLRELGYGSLFVFVFSSCSYSAIATPNDPFRKVGPETESSKQFCEVRPSIPYLASRSLDEPR